MKKNNSRKASLILLRKVLFIYKKELRQRRKAYNKILNEQLGLTYQKK